METTGERCEPAAGKQIEAGDSCCGGLDGHRCSRWSLEISRGRRRCHGGATWRLFGANTGATNDFIPLCNFHAQKALEFQWRGAENFQALCRQTLLQVGRFQCTRGISLYTGDDLSWCSGRRQHAVPGRVFEAGHGFGDRRYFRGERRADWAGWRSA